MLQTKEPSSKNTQNAELIKYGSRFISQNRFFRRKPPAWDFRAKTKIFHVSLHFHSPFSSLRLFQNFHVTARAFLAYTKIQAVLLPRNHFFSVGYSDQRPFVNKRRHRWLFDPSNYGKDYVFKQYYILFYMNWRNSDVREIKVMSTQDQRFLDIAPKVYYTICNPVKVCCE